MTQEQIGQAAKEHLETNGLLINHEEDNYAAGVFDGFLAGAESRQAEIDELKKEIKMSADMISRFYDYVRYVKESRCITSDPLEFKLKNHSK